MSIGFVSDPGEYYFQHQQIESVTENYQSVCRQTHYNVTDKNSNCHFEGLDMHYYKHHMSC
jgi:hypothetical protein